VNLWYYFILLYSILLFLCVRNIFFFRPRIGSFSELTENRNSTTTIDFLNVSRTKPTYGYGNNSVDSGPVLKTCRRHRFRPQQKRDSSTVRSVFSSTCSWDRTRRQQWSNPLLYLCCDYEVHREDLKWTFHTSMTLLTLMVGVLSKFAKYYNRLQICHLCEWVCKVFTDNWSINTNIF